MSALPDDAEVQALLQRLDQLVPREGAVVKLELYGGGPDETVMLGTRLGYLRVGIEMLKAAYLPARGSGNPETIEPDVDYLCHVDSSAGPNWFQRTEQIPVQSPTPPSLVDRILPAVVIGAIFATLVFAAIGFVSSIRWAF